MHDGVIRIHKKAGKEPDGSCKFFGSINPKNREVSERCKNCLGETPSMFAECVVESNNLLNTSILVNESGETVSVLVNGNENHKRIREKEKGKKMVNESEGNAVVVNGGIKAGKTAVGVLSLARGMLTEGKTTEEVMAALIQVYQTAGKSPKQAKHNAQSCLFNAKKKLATNQ